MTEMFAAVQESVAAPRVRSLALPDAGPVLLAPPQPPGIRNPTQAKAFALYVRSSKTNTTSAARADVRKLALN